MSIVPTATDLGGLFAAVGTGSTKATPVFAELFGFFGDAPAMEGAPLEEAVPLEQGFPEAQTPAPVVMKPVATTVPVPQATPKQIAEAVIRFMLKPAEPISVEEHIEIEAKEAVEVEIEVRTGDAPLLKERAEDWDVPLDWSSPDELVELEWEEEPQEAPSLDRIPLEPIAVTVDPVVLSPVERVEVPVTPVLIKEAEPLELPAATRPTVEARTVVNVSVPPPVPETVEREPLPEAVRTPLPEVVRITRAAAVPEPVAPLAFALNLRVEEPPREVASKDTPAAVVQETEAVLPEASVQASEPQAAPTDKVVVKELVRIKAPKTPLATKREAPARAVTGEPKQVTPLPVPEPEEAPIPAVGPVVKPLATRPEAPMPAAPAVRTLAPAPKLAPAVAVEVTDQESETDELVVEPHKPEPVEEHARPMSPLPQPKTVEYAPPPTHVAIPKAAPDVVVQASVKPVEVRESVPSPKISAAPEAQVIEEPKAPIPASATHEIAVRVSAPDSAPVDLHVKQRGAAVHVAVRTANEGLQTSLRQDLGNLVDRLQDSGFRTEKVVTPEPTARVSQETSRTFDLTSSIRTHGIEQQGTNFEQSSDRRQGDSPASSGDSHRENGARQQQQQQRRQNSSHYMNQYTKWRDAMEDQA